jgi:hypothetical protein
MTVPWADSPGASSSNLGRFSCSYSSSSSSSSSVRGHGAAVVDIPVMLRRQRLSEVIPAAATNALECEGLLFPQSPVYGICKTSAMVFAQLNISAWETGALRWR